MLIRCVLLMLTLFANTLLAAGGGGGEPEYVVNIVKVKSVYDGDTFRGYFDEKKQEPIRIKGVDTAEIKGKCEAEIAKAYAARDFLKATLVNATQIQLVEPSRDKFNRVLAQIIGSKFHW